MTALWCEWAWLGGEAADQGVVIEIDGELIASVTTGVASPPAGAARRGGITLPGLHNAHSHAFHRALRGRTHTTGSFWTWREQMYELASLLDPDSLHALARATYAEMTLAGITCVSEFHYVHHDVGGRPFADPNAMGVALVEAAGEVGLRVELVDACYLEGGIGRSLEGVQLRFGDRDVEAWAARVEALKPRPGLAVSAAIHSVRAVAPPDMTHVARYSLERGIPLHAHVSEQKAENQACIGAYGMTPTQLLHDLGALEADFTAVHAIHVSDADIQLLGEATVCLCPTTERDLADGIAPSGRLRDAGAAIALGSDSHAVVDLFEEARAVELDTRLATGERGTHTAAELLTAAVGDGIVVGGEADLVTARLDSPRLAGASDVVGSVVFAATAADVTDVMVAGRDVVVGGNHVSIDVAGELDRAIRSIWNGR